MKSLALSQQPAVNPHEDVGILPCTYSSFLVPCPKKILLQKPRIPLSTSEFILSLPWVQPSCTTAEIVSWTDSQASMRRLNVCAALLPRITELSCLCWIPEMKSLADFIVLQLFSTRGQAGVNYSSMTVCRSLFRVVQSNSNRMQAIHNFKFSSSCIFKKAKMNK